jgi:3-hydroxyacyl-CoA dehydrogenase/enoyl-CoA hydratase/3-hydroxybutyryl-CoA epimerase
MLGAGFMGAGITEVSIKNDLKVVLKDIKDDTLASARKTIWKGFAKKIKRRIIKSIDAEKTMNRLRTQLDYTGFETVDVVVEAVLENMGLKKKIIQEVEPLLKDKAIFASNTSSLSLTEMSKASSRPEQVIGMHYFSPVPKMPLLEIVKTDKTADWVIASCYNAGIKQGKTCIVVKDTPGFYVNRILAPYLNECMLLIEEGAGIKEVDEHLLDKGFPVGPFALMDEVGIDIGAHIMSGDLMAAVQEREGITVSQALPKMFEQGYLGRKNKKGHYDYDKKTGKRGKVSSDIYEFYGGGERRPIAATDIKNRPLMLMINEALMCLEEGIIANPTDGDTGAVFGIGFLPYTGGPFRFIDTMGAKKIIAIMEGFEKRFGVKFHPAKILYTYAEQGKKFHP